MYSQYGWSEMFLYKAQLLFESELDKKTNTKVLEALEKEVIKQR
jgi:tRNA U54 and U55 pseudouridine synthase Pus10